MEIPLTEGRTLGFERDMISFSVKYGSLNPMPFLAIVDTGCPFTFLSSDSFLGKRAPPMGNVIEKSPISLGPILLEMKDLGKCKLFFRDVNNNLKEFEHRLLLGTPINKGIILAKIPCFLGKDFLDENKISIINKDGKKFLSRSEID